MLVVGWLDEAHQPALGVTIDDLLHGEDRRCHELQVRHATEHGRAMRVDQFAEAVAHRAEIEQRAKETRPDRGLRVDLSAVETAHSAPPVNGLDGAELRLE